MLNSLFKPAWKSTSASKRLGAISTLNGDNSEHQEVLLQLAQDVDSAVSIAAIEKISSLTSLLDLTNNLSDDSIRSKTDQRIDQLLSADNTINEQDYLKLLDQYPQITDRIATLASIASVRIEAIKKLSADQLLGVLGSCLYTDARQYIAENLTSLEQLEAARKILHGKDKNAERILKTRIDEIRKAARIKAENLATVAKLIEEAEYLASHDWLPEFQAKFQAHRKLWDSIQFEIQDTAKLQYQKFRDIIEKRFEEQRIVEEALQSRQQIQSEIAAYIEKLEQRDLTTCIDTRDEIQSKQDEFASRWQELEAKNAADKSQQASYKSKIQALQSASRLICKAAELLQPDSPGGEESHQDIDLSSKIQKLSSLLKNLKWPDAYGELSVLSQLQQQLEDWRNQKLSQAAEKEEKLAKLHKKISSVSRFSRAGNLARAKQTFERAERALKQYTGKELARLQERLEEARKTMGDMGDWKNFATEPKYIELCDAMQSLIDSKLHPDKLSAKIKELQQQWKSLGHSEISDQYWPRFKETADKVYKPCVEFFEQRRQTRKEHLEQRQQFVEQMRELLESTDWENDPDYKLAQSKLRKISDHFFEIKDVEHGPGQKQWKKFSALKDQVYARLEIAYEANIELKHQLIKQVTTLAEAEAREENLATLKTLQTRWKNVGVTRRNADQKAWKEFKKQGDIVFSNVQSLRKGHREEVDQQLNAYRAVIRDIQKLAKTAKDLSQSDQQFTELQAQYAELPELPESLPEKLTRGIQQDYRKACDQFDNSHNRIVNSIHNQQINALREKADLCAQLESLGESPADAELEKISLQWDGIELKDTQLARRIDARRESAQQPVDREVIGAQRKMLCIQLEIATGKESPDEDKSIRMQYQLEQMNKSGLGQQAFHNNDQLEQMEIDWLCMPGAEPTLQKALDKRFYLALKSG